MPSNTNNTQLNAEAAPDIPSRDSDLIQHAPRRYKPVEEIRVTTLSVIVVKIFTANQLLDRCPSRDAHEFTHMWYSAVICDPDHFKDSHFTLCQMHYEPPRRTELLIGITMSNEDEELFSQTMTSDVLATMGVYNEDLVKTQVNSKNVTAHIYKYTTPIPAARSRLRTEINGLSLFKPFLLKGKDLRKTKLTSMDFQRLRSYPQSFLMKYLCPRLLQKAGYSLRDVLRWGQIPLQNNLKTGKGPLQKYSRHDTEHDGAGANTSPADKHP
ncbi:hypothetical protein H1R20_g5300, partial [Candolleomyces eurysporus]